MTALAAPVQAGPVRYDRIIRCAAHHFLLSGLLQTSADPKAHKKEIKAENDQVKSYMDLAHMLLDPPDVPYGRIQSDTKAVYLDLVARAQHGEAMQGILEEGEAVCQNLSGD